MALLLALALLAQPISAETLAELERSYDQSCNTRLYGQLDDVCSDLEAKVKAYRRELRKRPRGNAPAASPARAATPTRTAPVPDPAASNPALPKDAADAAPSPASPNASDPLVRAFEAVRDTGARADDHAEIAADDAGATSLAEEIGAGSQKP